MDHQKISPFWIVIFATILTTSAQYFYKTGSASDVIFYLNVNFILALSLYILAAGFVMLALKRGELSYVYPILATSFLWVAILSTLVFHETLTLLNWTGISLIIGGVITLK